MVSPNIGTESFVRESVSYLAGFFNVMRKQEDHMMVSDNCHPRPFATQEVVGAFFTFMGTKEWERDKRQSENMEKC